MTNYGPPLRFKAVDTKTGEFGETKPPIDCERKGLAVCQSTGLKDCAGVGIFFGDVLYCEDKEAFYIAYFDENDAVCRMDEIEDWDSITAGLDPGGYLADEALYRRVVGNCWEPREVLEKRAKETSK